MKIILMLSLLIALNASANEEVVKNFVADYDQGTLKFSPTATDNGLVAQPVYDEFFAKTHDRKLLLKNVRWNDTRITADLYTMVDGKETSGSITIWHDHGVITKIIHDHKVWPEPETKLNMADAGQLADKGSTVVALASGFQETNPILTAGGGAGAAAVLPLFMVMRKSLQDKDLSQCISANKGIGSMGFGAGASNLVVLLGIPFPANLIAGLSTYVTTAKTVNYKSSCVDGEVRMASVGGINE